MGLKNELNAYIYSLRELVKKKKDGVEQFARGRNIRLAQLLDRGQSYCKSLIPIGDTGTLQKGVSISFTYSGGLIKTGRIYLIGDAKEYGKYVEFGTGVIGEKHPHPEYNDYDRNEYGEKGWVYKGKDGKFHHTLGQPSKAFMYKTFIYLKNLISMNVTNLKWYDITFTTEDNFSPVIIITKR
jgi:hypothetical protein